MSNHLSVESVRTAGKGVRYAEAIAADVVAATSETYDWTARGAVPAAILAALGLTKDTAPKQREGKAGEQTATDFGRGMDAVAAQVRKLIKSDDPKPVTLRATLSGEGGGSVTIPTDHPLYDALVAMITGGESADETSDLAA